VPIGPPLVGPYERLILLEALSLSGHPPTEALAALAQQATEHHLAAGRTLIGEDAWGAAHVVVEGRITVSESAAGSTRRDHARPLDCSNC
jgi:hypothetical protein